MSQRLVTLLMCAVLLVPALARAQARPVPAPVRPVPAPVARHTPAEEIEEIRSEIARVERLLSERNAQNWGRAQERLSIIREKLGTLARRMEAEGRHDQERARARAEEVARRPMAANLFEDMRIRIADEVNDGRRTMQLKAYIPSNWFSTTQVRTLLDLYRRDADRMGALQLLAPRVSDRQNLLQLQDAFSRRADKDKARSILSP